jgi:cobalt/nickel transport system ATP-binding protein
MDVIAPVINVKGLSYNIGGKSLLRDINLRLMKGEKIGLTGPIGSGKTTFLLLLVGLLKPLDGSIEILGIQRTTEADFAAVRRIVGFQFQDPDDQLFCPTVAEDIAFGPLNLGRTREEALGIVDQTLELVGLTSFDERVIHHLSEGEKRLVSLATVLAMNPEILLLDEPTSGLDAVSRERTARVLRDLPQSMIVVSHDSNFLKSACDRVLQLSGGFIS